MNIIETFDLKFSYAKHRTINGVSLQVPQGAIYGLLGRNGSGKSTLLKLLLGLLPSDKNRIKYFGNLKISHDIFYRIGSLIETPSCYDFMTVREHIEMCDIIFKKGDCQIDNVINIVGLQSEINKHVKKLSTGQKQRLGIAMAIFRDPDVLILDEPLNGLDSVGIIDMRNLLIKLHCEGKTILLTSHIISELEKLCTNIGIIENGDLVFQGGLDMANNESLEDYYLSFICK